MIVKTSLIPRPYDGVTVWPFIFVRPEKADNQSLINHEMIHYREQAWITPWWLLKYFFSRDFKLNAEARAYAVQVKSGSMSKEEAARWLTTYDSSLDQTTALGLLEANLQ